MLVVAVGLEMIEFRVMLLAQAEQVVVVLVLLLALQVRGL